MSQEDRSSVIFVNQVLHGQYCSPRGSSSELQCGLKEYFVHVGLPIHTVHAQTVKDVTLWQRNMEVQLCG